MFSLIITIIAIALVAALALATIYYGGSAFNKGASSANAAKLMNQSQQILGADRLYRVDHEGAMPPSMQALVDGGYLRTIPVAQINGQFDAVAASTAWTMVASPSGRAYTFSSGDVDLDSCKAVNQMAFGQDGVLNKVFAGFKTQCYGPDSSHLAIVVVADPAVLGADGSTNTELPNSPVIKDGSAPAAGDWTTAPSTQTSSGGTGSGGSGVTGANRLQVTVTDLGNGNISVAYTALSSSMSLADFRVFGAQNPGYGPLRGVELYVSGDSQFKAGAEMGAANASASLSNPGFGSSDLVLTSTGTDYLTMSFTPSYGSSAWTTLHWQSNGQASQTVCFAFPLRTDDSLVEVSGSVGTCD